MKPLPESHTETIVPDVSELVCLVNWMLVDAVSGECREDDNDKDKEGETRKRRRRKMVVVLIVVKEMNKMVDIMLKIKITMSSRI